MTINAPSSTFVTPAKMLAPDSVSFPAPVFVNSPAPLKVAAVVKSRVGLAPFSNYVNVGTTYFNAVTNNTASGGTDSRTCVKERDNANRYSDVVPNATNGFFKRYNG